MKTGKFGCEGQAGTLDDFGMTLVGDLHRKQEVLWVSHFPPNQVPERFRVELGVQATSV